MARWLKHLFTTTRAGRRAFPQASLEAIQKAIASGEKRHRAELRLIIEASMPLSALLDRLSSRDRARELFSLYRIWDTEENIGVLLYINLADHKVEIIADRGAGKKIEKREWEDICRTMTAGFKAGAFRDSTIAGLEKLNALLAERFPADGANPNELSNRPLIV
ncbi:MAG: hypothetical protein K0S28_2344 [Paucimonas sp.]|jgi:uncharacterized membrane protein|nr:hypothetical protein [Paucimonas sp.]